MKAVLDTNVLVSAVLSSQGPPARILEAWFRGAFELVTSPMLLDELERVLNYPKIRERITESEGASFLRLISDGSVSHVDPVEVSSITSRDPDGNYLIRLAYESRSLLISGDRDLLELADRIPVRSPKAFLAMLDPG